MGEVIYRQDYTLMGLPKWVFNNEGGAAWIDTQHGRYWLKPGDVILYNADWNPIDVIRARNVGKCEHEKLVESHNGHSCAMCGELVYPDGCEPWAPIDDDE